MSKPSRFMTVAEICADLCVPRSTWDDWKAKGRGPRCIKLPNGQIRVRRTEYERWLETREDAA
jgi:predicted DNA-binding transcriptional regulator AlpA